MGNHVSPQTSQIVKTGRIDRRRSRPQIQEASTITSVHFPGSPLNRNVVHACGMGVSIRLDVSRHNSQEFAGKCQVFVVACATGWSGDRSTHRNVRLRLVMGWGCYSLRLDRGNSSVEPIFTFKSVCSICLALPMPSYLLNASPESPRFSALYSSGAGSYVIGLL